MRYHNDGLSLWTDTPDAPATARSITVAVSPAHPANAVEVRVRADGGPERIVRAVPVPLPVPAQPGVPAQYFHAVLPFLSPGVGVSVLPTLLCAGRRCPAPGTAEPLRLLTDSPRMDSAVAPGDPPTAADSAAPSGERFGYAMDFLGTVWVALRSPPEIIGVVPQGLRVNYYITDGGCAGPRLNARIRPEGADWMLIQRDGVAIPGVRTTWETVDGALLYGEYSGVFDLGPEGYANALAGRFPTLPVVQLAPRFVTSDARYAWLNRKQCLGVGAVHMDKLRVEYDLYATATGRRRVG